MRKLITLTLALFFTAGMAFGQTSGETGVQDRAVVVDPGASVDQTGNDNDASIDQTSNGTGTLGAGVDQDGNNNAAQIEQVSNAVIMESLIDQDGNRNRATTSIQSSTANSATGEVTETLQIQVGDDNRASVMGTGIVQDLRAEQTQVGNANVARFTGLANAQGYQEQRGNRNTARATDVQKATRIEQYQDGDDNTATFESSSRGSLGRSYQDQHGNNNVSRVRSFAGRTNEASSLADTDQRGNRNVATIDFMSNRGNTGLIGQFGDDNVGRIVFGGGGNMAEIYQDGNHNRAIITQNAAGGMADIMQDGNRNNATITQQ